MVPDGFGTRPGRLECKNLNRGRRPEQGRWRREKDESTISVLGFFQSEQIERNQRWYDRVTYERGFYQEKNGRKGTWRKNMLAQTPCWRCVLCVDDDVTPSESGKFWVVGVRKRRVVFCNWGGNFTAKSARPATNLPSATFLQPFYHMQHSCNIICNTLYSATYLQHMPALAATRIACNIVCSIVCQCNTVIFCNTSFHQTPFEDGLGVGDSNSRRASSYCFSPHTRPISAAILRIRPFLLFASSIHTCLHHIVAFFHFSKY